MTEYKVSAILEKSDGRKEDSAHGSFPDQDKAFDKVEELIKKDFQCENVKLDRTQTKFVFSTLDGSLTIRIRKHNKR